MGGALLVIDIVESSLGLVRRGLTLARGGGSGPVQTCNITTCTAVLHDLATQEACCYVVVANNFYETCKALSNAVISLVVNHVTLASSVARSCKTAVVTTAKNFAVTYYDDFMHF